MLVMQRKTGRHWTSRQQLEGQGRELKEELLHREPRRADGAEVDLLMDLIQVELQLRGGQERGRLNEHWAHLAPRCQS